MGHAVPDIVRHQLAQPLASVRPCELDSLIGGIERYTFTGLLGQGTFSTVLLATKHGRTFAVKRTRLYHLNPLISIRLLREAALLAHLDEHDNLVKVYEQIRTPGYHYLVEEALRDSVTLEQLVVASEGGVLSSTDVWQVLEQLSSVIKSLHTPLQVVHRDIKPENILIQRLPTSIKLTLLDFGLATQYSKSLPSLSTCCGSPAYHSPELYNGLRREGGVRYWGPEVDIWCLGLTILRCVSPHRYPLGLSHLSIQDLSDKIRHALRTVQDRQLRKILTAFLQIDSSTRMMAFDAYCLDKGFRGNDSRKREREFKSLSFLPTSLKHSLELILLPSRTYSSTLSPPPSPRPPSPLSSLLSPSLESTPFPTPLEIILLNPQQEEFERCCSFLRYALRCHSILYHVLEEVVVEGKAFIQCVIPLPPTIIVEIPMKKAELVRKKEEVIQALTFYLELECRGGSNLIGVEGGGGAEATREEESVFVITLSDLRALSTIRAALTFTPSSASSSRKSSLGADHEVKGLRMSMGPPARPEGKVTKGGIWEYAADWLGIGTGGGR